MNDTQTTRPDPTRSGPTPSGTTQDVGPPPHDRPSTTHERGPWRDRLPELLAVTGATLVALAVTGFLASVWDDISQIQKAMVLAAAAGGLTASGLWLDGRSPRRRFEFVVGVAWATATLLIASAATLTATTLWPDVTRMGIALAGIAAATHAAALWARHPESVIQQVSLLGALLYAAGPFGTEIDDRYGIDQLFLLGEPLLSLSDPTITSDAFVLTGVAHAVVGAVWLVLAYQLDGRAGHIAATAGTVLLGFAALELNVLTSPVGAVAALAIVLGYLLYGLWRDEPLLIVVGVIGALVAGVRVLAALFTGHVAVTILVFAGGLALLGWAFRQIRRRQSDEAGD